MWFGLDKKAAVGSLCCRMEDPEEDLNLDDLDDEDNVFVPIRTSNRSADYYEETQRSFQELRIKMEEDSALARQAMDRELEKLHRLFFRQDLLGTRERHRRQRRRPAVSDTSSSSDTDTMASTRVTSRKARSSTPGPRLEGVKHGKDRNKQDCERERDCERDCERDRKRLCQSKTSGHWTAQTSHSNMSG